MNPEQFEKAMQNFAVAFQTELPKILMNGANVGSALMQRRIFNKGQSADLETMHYRNKRYKLLRTDAGLQVGVKDLEFTGNLFNSLTLMRTAPYTVAYQFNNAESAQIANYQEGSDQVGKIIFALANKEAEAVERAVNMDFKRLAERAVANSNQVPNLAPQLNEKPVKSRTAIKKKAIKKKANKSVTLREKLRKANARKKRLGYK